MKERREGRVGTVSGLALLAGGTALAAAVGGDHQSLSATLLLGTLTLGLGHSLIEEMKRQTRRAQPRWTREDTTNSILLGVWAEAALLMSILAFDTRPTRGLGLVLAVAYAACCGFFVTERRRTLTPHTDPARQSSGVVSARPTVGASSIAKAPPATGTAGGAPGTAEAPRTDTVSGTATILEDADTSGPATAHHAASTAGGAALPGGAVLRRGHPGHAGHAPTAGHGPMTRSHAAGHASTLPGHKAPPGHTAPLSRKAPPGHKTPPGHDRPASLQDSAVVAGGRPVRSEAPR